MEQTAKTKGILSRIGWLPLTAAAVIGSVAPCVAAPPRPVAPVHGTIMPGGPPRPDVMRAPQPVPGGGPVLNNRANPVMHPAPRAQNDHPQVGHRGVIHHSPIVPLSQPPL
jgi:hypothetical protein